MVKHRGFCRKQKGDSRAAAPFGSQRATGLPAWSAVCFDLKTGACSYMVKHSARVRARAAVPEEISRYSRHELLRVIGTEGQEKITKSRVLVAGLGALGSVIAMLLARAGVGFLRIVDIDAPEMHNLQRQVLYEEADVGAGTPKAEAARIRLLAANSQIAIEAVTARIGSDNIDELMSGIDLVVDALDNTPPRYAINDAICARGIPYVFGGAVETVGNVMSILPGRTPCLRCLWPDPEAVVNHPRASDVGVLSSVATAVAAIEVTEALKILIGDYEELISGLLVLDIWRNQYQVAALEPDPSCICRKSTLKL
jgi:adenylyltransferase/sulfurtransferase